MNEFIVDAGWSRTESFIKTHSTRCPFPPPSINLNRHKREKFLLFGSEIRSQIYSPGGAYTIIGQLAHEFGQMLPLRSFLSHSVPDASATLVLSSAPEPSRRIIKNPIPGAAPAHAIYLYALLSVCRSAQKTAYQHHYAFSSRLRHYFN